MKNTIFFTLFLFTLSCTEDHTKGKETGTKEKPNVESEYENDKKLTIQVDLEMSSSEDIKLMAVNTFLNNGKYMDIYITQHFNANETSKTVKFEMPQDVLPDNFVGISFGPKKVKEIKINNIKLAFNKTSYDINTDQVLDFFKTNQYLQYDENKKVFKTKPIEGKHNPILILRKKYIDKITGTN